MSTFNFRELKFKWVKIYHQCVVCKLHREFQSLLVRFYHSVIYDSLQPHGLQHIRLPYVTNSWSLLKHVHLVDDAIQQSHALSSNILLPSIFPSIWVFSNEPALHIRWPKNWSFSLSISPTNEHSQLISFRIDWFDPLAVQGTPESSPILQFKNMNSLALSLFIWCNSHIPIWLYRFD